jgi:hypothetical protein
MKKTIRVWTIDYFEENIDISDEKLSGKSEEEIDESFEDIFLDKWSNNDYDPKEETKVYFEKDDEFGLIKEIVDIGSIEESFDEDSEDSENIEDDEEDEDSEEGERN